MRNLLFTLTFTLFSTSVLSGQIPTQLSDNARISIITMGPYYGELYSAFGHSAIRVLDPPNNIDLAFNYGTFDDSQPNFYLNFARGRNYYKLSIQNYGHLKQYYIYYNRFIHEQILDLNPDQKQVVFEFLIENARPENATYNYDYFYDNCATRIRDVFVQTLGYQIRFESNHIQTKRSIRELTDDYLVGHYPWGDLGIDLCLGLPMDKILAPTEYMFLPDYVESAFDRAWIKSGAGEKPLVSDKIIVFDPPAKPEKKTVVTPFLTFLSILIAIAILTRLHIKRGKKGRYVDVVLFFIVGLLGLFLLLLWFATDHKAAAGNLNLIWAFPLHLFAAFALLRNSISGFWRYYFRTVAIVMALLLLAWPLLPQMVHTSLMFISASVMVRAAFIGWGRAYAASQSSTRE